MEKEKKKLPAKEINILVGQSNYTIKFPSTGQLIDIERMKLQLTAGTHKDMLFGQPSAQQAYLLTATIATFSVLIPQLEKDLNVKSLLELDAFQCKGIVKEYSEKYYPWFKEWTDAINEDVE